MYPWAEISPFCSRPHREIGAHKGIGTIFSIEVMILLREHMQNWRDQMGQSKTILLEKLREALSSVLPIVLIVLVLCFSIAPPERPA